MSVSQFGSVGCYLLLVTACVSGCHGLPAALGRWPTPAQQDVNVSTAQAVNHKSSSADDTLPTNAAISSADGTFPGPTTHEEAMAAVLQDLEEIRAIDPQAQQQLLQDLMAAKPTLWPLMVRQFRAALSYRQQLAETDASKNRPVERVSNRRTRDDSASAESTGELNGDSTSAFSEIGDLVDPRGLAAELKNEESFVQAARLQQKASTTGPPPHTTDMAEMLATRLDENAEAISTAAASHQGVIMANYEVGHTRPRSVAADETQHDGYGVEPALFELPESTTDLTWQEHVEEALVQLNATSATTPRTAEEVVDLARIRLLHLVMERPSEGVSPIAGISPSEREYWSKQLFALATMMDVKTLPDSKRRASASALHLEESLQNLREMGVLTVRNLVFCREVFDYGAYEIYPSDRFSPGRQVSLYAEVENYKSELTEKGYYTSLASSYEVLNDDGQSVASGDFPDVEDYCRNRRRDFHIQYGLSLPERVPHGHYRLQLTIRDNLSNKLGQNVIEFDIVGTTDSIP